MKHPSIRLHCLAPYDRGAKARWVLTELGLPFETRWLDREAKEYESPAFLKLNPLGRVPVLEFGEQAVFESDAICAFLADRYLDRGLAPMPSAPERAEYLQWLHFAGSTLDQIQTRIMIIEDIPPGELFDKKMGALLGDFRDAVSALEQALARRDHLLSTGRFSVADVCVGFHLYWCLLWPELEAIARDYPRLVGYLERLKKMPSASKANVFSYPA